MSNNADKPGVMHSFLGGLALTILLVVVVPALTAYFIAPRVDEYLGGIVSRGFTSATIVTAVMLLVMMLILLKLGGRSKFKK